MSNSVAPAGGSDGGGGLFVYDESRDTYDLNTRILATAVICLACVVVLMVFVHLYVRQALLGGRGAAARQRTTAGASHLLRFYVSDRPAGQEGLDPAAISALPAHPYRAPAATTDGGGGEAAECAICLGAVAEEEAVRVMPGCKHMFHVDCIDIWLGSHSTCPVCRTAVEPPPAVGEAPPPSESKEPGPASFRFGSFRRMLSWERSSMGRRAQGEGMEDNEAKQIPFPFVPFPS